jgi:hypothetical protein
MIGHNEAETLFRTSFERHAEQAPDAAGLLARVRERQSRGRRRRGRAAGSVALAASATAMALLAAAWISSAGSETVAQPERFRWESYRNVEVRVPDDWGYGTTGKPPCMRYVNVRGEGGFVGRPGGLPLVYCDDDSGSEQPIDEDRPYLWFDDDAKPGVHDYGDGWVEQTRVVAGVGLTVFTDDDQLRARILDSARPAGETDVYGCPTASPSPFIIDVHPKGIDAVGRVEQVVRCTYTLTEDRARLWAGSRLEGKSARAAIDAILAAPEGSGPNQPDECSDERPYGNEAMLLIVLGGERSQDVVSYDGCDNHGVDDGVTERRLTGDVLESLLTGPHEPVSYHRSIAGLLGD